MGRRAVVKGFQDVAETLLYLFGPIAQDAEDFFLHLTLVDADAAARQL